MTIFQDPNIMYILLAGGFLLIFLAIISPGTGLLELGAVFVFILAGYGIYTNNLPINLWALVVLVVGVIPFLVAVRTSRQLIFLVVAIVAFAIGSAYLFQGQAWWEPGVNPILALVISGLIGSYLWIAFRKAFEAEARMPVHDLGALIGQVGEAKTNVEMDGAVQVGGQLWSAYSKARIPAGSRVRVVAREGFILEVEQVQG